MKYINLFVLLFVLLNFIYSTQAFCSKCFEEGQACLTPYQDNMQTKYRNEGNCGNGLTCSPPFPDAEPKDYICTKFAEEGGRCTGDILCDIGLYCQASVCRSGYFADIGEDCNSDSDCFSSLATCIKGVCTNLNGTCKGDDENYCRNGQYCKNDVCVDQLAVGQPCEDSSDCYDNLVCDSQTDLCRSPTPKKALGSACTFSIECDQLNSALYCKSGTCEKYVVPDANPITQCNVDPTASNARGSCDEYHRCSCDGKCYQNSIYPTQMLELQQPFIECMSVHNCTEDGNNYSSDSCMSRNCGSQYCKYLRAVNTDDNELTCGNTYWVDEYCSRNNSSKLTFSVLFTILISVILLLL